MPEDNTQITPTMPPVNNDGATQDYSNNGMSDVADFAATAPVSNPAAQAAPTVDAPKTDELVDSPIVMPEVPSQNTKSVETSNEKTSQDNVDIYTELTGKIRASKNILIALSSNPSVDEMAAAIGLSLYLDKLGKRATAIYSGVTPNALEFLKPEETFESTADALQDFVIALNKEKADHLRYKLDGEFVKIYITPYKTRIAENDLDFSYGDFNVDLVLALDVANGVDLDSALREHGRIMHDAVIVNISTSKPGKFGEIEWSDKTASSVSEMIAKLLYNVGGDVQIGKEEATAFLTGIVAATNRFANAKTTPETMKTASKLMKSGANQQLVSKNITPDVENEIMSLYTDKKVVDNSDPTKLDIDHEGDRNSANSEKEVDAEIADKESTLLDDLKAAEASLAQAGAEAVEEPNNEPIKIDTNEENGDLANSDNSENVAEPMVSAEPEMISAPEVTIAPSASMESEAMVAPEVADVESDLNKTPSMESEDNAGEASNMSESLPTVDEQQTEKVVRPEADFNPDEQDEFEGDKYGHMLEEALDDNKIEENPAVASAPNVPEAPEINGVPEMNYSAVSNEGVLPPPPAPPVDIANGMLPTQEAAQNIDGQMTAALPEVQPIEAAAPPEEPTLTSLGAQPAMQDQVYNSQAADPGAFKIPGM